MTPPPGSPGSTALHGSRGPAAHPVVLLLWLAALTALALAAQLQSLLAPRWPQAELPKGFADGLRLGDRPLKLLRTLPSQRDRDRAMGTTLVFALEEAPADSRGNTSAQMQPQGGASQELWLLAVQTRHRSDLAVPRLVRDRPELQLKPEPGRSRVRILQAGPAFGYGQGLWQGRPALQTCLSGPGQGGYSEMQLTRLRDHPPPPGVPRLLHLLGLRDIREFSCVLVTVQQARQP